jgi:hypothetical protein
VRVALRFISLVLVVVALLLLGADAITSLDRGGQVTVRSMDQVWSLLGPSSIGAFKAWLEHRLPAPIPRWAYVVMALPAWALSGVLGVVLAFVFGRHASQER